MWLETSSCCWSWLLFYLICLVNGAFSFILGIFVCSKSRRCIYCSHRWRWLLDVFSHDLPLYLALTLKSLQNELFSEIHNIRLINFLFDQFTSISDTHIIVKHLNLTQFLYNFRCFLRINFIVMQVNVVNNFTDLLQKYLLMKIYLLAGIKYKLNKFRISYVNW